MPKLESRVFLLCLAVATAPVWAGGGCTDLAVSFAGDSPTSVVAGGPLQLGVRLTVTGDFAHEVTLRTIVPPGTRFDLPGSGGSQLWDCPDLASAGTLCTAALGKLGDQIVFQVLSLVVDANHPAGRDAITVEAAASALNPECTPGNNGDSHLVGLEAQPDLELALEHGGGVEPGAVVQIELTSSNTGSQNATGVQLHIGLPPGASFVSEQSSLGWLCLPSAQCTVLVGALGAPAGEVARTFAFQVDPNLAPEVTEVEVCGTAADDASNGADPDGADACLAVPILRIPPQVTESRAILEGETTVPLAGCEQLVQAPTQLEITFDEALEPTSAAQATSWRVVAAGADRDIATFACNAVAGDDVPIAITSASWLAETKTAVLTLGTVPSGPVLLLGCGATLEDLAGQPLDGNGDGTGGDDWAISFRHDPGNLFVGGRFDCGVGSWTVMGTVNHLESVDADGAEVSGSVEWLESVPGEVVGLSRCVHVEGVRRLRLSTGYILLSSAPAVLSHSCELFLEAGCAGSLGAQQRDTAIDPVLGPFETLRSWFDLPEMATSARCSVAIVDPEGAGWTALVDDLELRRAELFADDFELGSTAAWSATVP